MSTVKRGFWSALGLLAILWILPAAAVPIQGTFTASQACPAYVSKNRQTNPGEVRLRVGTAYTAIEANLPTAPHWYRVQVPGADPPERWVSRGCGSLAATAAGTEGRRRQAGGVRASGQDECSTPGLADSYVLALTWQPAFCETEPAKPECRINDPSSYQARNFTLHGLWPNRARCGISYGFCGKLHRESRDFCNDPPVDLAAPALTALSQVMPSVAAHSCVERHEWYKHGTCQTRWSDDEYFEVSADLVCQFNEAGMAYFMSRRLGKQVRVGDFLARLDAVLGAGSRGKVRLDCDRGMLVEVQLSLPADLTPGEDLDALLARAKPLGGGDCGRSFQVDRIGTRR
jgi:ribonuclease T2